MYWNTGFNQAPQIVKLCLSSWKQYNKNWNIIELDDNNLSNWIDLNVVQGTPKSFTYTAQGIANEFFTITDSNIENNILTFILWNSLLIY